MAIYIAMLRGINLGGHKKIKMDALRQTFEKLGFEQVQTYIQSGNVVFQAGKTSAAALSKRIEEKIVEDFGFSASVICRSVDELGAVVARNPLLKQRGIDPEKLHVTFLSEPPALPAWKQLEALIAAPDQARFLGKEIYFYLPNGVSQSILMKRPVDRLLGVITTTRNWRTVNRLREMCKGEGS
ncbi:MAG: DUF1697 domain-containing protein [Candidatus Sulfotelmatobacter sp.]|jgi:uncharacterized protein (DUF1697 family)